MTWRNYLGDAAVPIADGGVDVPVLEWCPILDAAMWIEHRQAPVAWGHQNALPNRIYPPLGVYRDQLDFCAAGWGKLFVLACAGGVTLRGYPAIEFRGIEYKNGLSTILSDGFGEVEDIPLERINKAGMGGFIDNGMNFFYEDDTEKWAYSFIRVDVKTLMARHPPTSDQDIRIGGDLLLVVPASEHDKLPEKSKQAAPRVIVAKKPKSIAETPRKPPPELVPVPPDLGSTTTVTAQANQPRNGLLRTPAAAEYLGLSKSTLEKYRLRGDGPRYSKLGKSCVYGIADLDAWVKARSRNSTSEPS